MSRIVQFFFSSSFSIFFLLVSSNEHDYFKNTVQNSCVLSFCLYYNSSFIYFIFQLDSNDNIHFSPAQSVFRERKVSLPVMAPNEKCLRKQLERRLQANTETAFLFFSQLDATDFQRSLMVNRLTKDFVSVNVAVQSIIKTRRKTHKRAVEVHNERISSRKSFT